MKAIRTYGSALLILLLLTLQSGCHAQDFKTPSGFNEAATHDRPAAVAGSFYPSDAFALRTMLGDFFSKSGPAKVKNVFAIICPHAGYEFSGIVDANSFRQLDPDKQYDNVFIIGSSHHVSFNGASVYNIGDYLTPLGKVKVNITIAGKLINENQVFTFNPDADKNEHCVEVLVPFLQYYLKKSFSIVPVVLGTQSAATCKKIAAALQPFMNGHNLFIISTDFSHYPSYNDAVSNDKRTCDAIVSNKPLNLLATIKSNEQRNITNLATSLCGWTSVLTFMDMTEGQTDIEYTPIVYRNSGDSKYQDKKEVVGYWSVAISKENKDEINSAIFSLSNKDKKELLSIARSSIDQYIRKKTLPEPDVSRFSPTLKAPAGAFVTIHKGRDLRGCMGILNSDQPLYQVVQDMAIAAAKDDNRFPPVEAVEINKISIEISVLTPMKRIISPDDIVLGRDGIFIRKGNKSGTFLPQVANGAGWTKESFLGRCSEEKAGIGWDGWKTAELYTYQAIVFSE